MPLEQKIVFLLARALSPLTFIFCLSPRAQAFSIAEIGYQLLNGDCPKAQQKTGFGKVSEKSSELACRPDSSPERRLDLLKTDLGVFSEDAYLAALAEERAQALTCAHQQTSALLQNSEDSNAFAKEVTEKLLLLLREKKKMADLSPAIVSGSISSSEASPTPPGSPRDEYKRARMRSELILDSIPFRQSPAMQKLINLVSAQDGYILGGKLTDGVEEIIQEMVKRSLPSINHDFEESAAIMAKGARTLGGSLDNANRESLAQDTDLIESFRQKHKQDESTLKAISCRVDSKYGKGAQYRDRALISAAVLAAPFSEFFVAAEGFAVEVTGAAARGSISIRTAGLLRSASLAIDSTLLLRQVQTNCGSDLATVGGSMAANRCEASILSTLSNEDCVFSVAMNLLGAPGLSKNVTETMRMIRGEIPSGGAQTLSRVVPKAENSESSLSLAAKEAVRKARQRELNRYGDLKTFRYSEEQVFEFREKYPKLAKRIDANYEKNRKMSFRSPVFDEADQLNDQQKIIDRYYELDQKNRLAIKKVWSRMNDEQAFADYTRSLSEDAAVEMMKSGTARDLAALEKGEITQTAVLKVLVKRYRAQGNDQFSSLVPYKEESEVITKGRKPDHNAGFRSAVGQGPFFDKPFRRVQHGEFSHLVQMDYVSDVIYKETGGNPRQFWDLLGSKKGIHFWEPLFDSGYNETLASPEAINSILKKQFHWSR